MRLRQSGDIPIHVYMRSEVPPNDRGTDMPLLQSRLRRVTRVEIHGLLSTMSDLLRKNARHYPVPSLRSLSRACKRLDSTAIQYSTIPFNCKEDGDLDT